MYSIIKCILFLFLQESDGEKSDENLVVDVGDVSPLCCLFTFE